MSEGRAGCGGRANRDDRLARVVCEGGIQSPEQVAAAFAAGAYAVVVGRAITGIEARVKQFALRTPAAQGIGYMLLIVKYLKFGNSIRGGRILIRGKRLPLEVGAQVE